MVKKYYTIYGGYSRSGNANNVVLGGSPERVLSPFGLDLTTAHDNSVGYGIGFENEENNISYNLSLVAFSMLNNNAITTGEQKYIGNGHVSQNDYDYNWLIRISLDNGNGWEILKNTQIGTYKGATPLVYANGWQRSTLNFDENFTVTDETIRVRFEIYGENPTAPYEIIFTREQIIRRIKPYAIRKNGIFKTLNRASGFFKIRKSNIWLDKSEIEITDINQIDRGSNRIRKNGNFLGQNKKGEL